MYHPYPKFLLSDVKILNNLFEKSGTLQQHFQFLGYKWH
ncbi:hypothetical protein T08_1006 [Trichinella sp. T8]|nr:hypothetical protein T08_1006 [Trichinella sp. T8]